MKQRDFDDILNECIERIIKGESVESCLETYPANATELEPLLRTAEDTLKAAAITPRPEFRQQAGNEFQAALLNLKPQKSGFFRWQARWVTVVSAVIVILLAGGGTVAASSNSLPDEPLYVVKLVTENIRLALTTSELGKAELYAEFANRRVDEIIKMAEKGKASQVVKATDRMNDQLIAIANLSLPSWEDDTAVEETQAEMILAPSTEVTDTQTAMPPSVAPVPSVITAPEPAGTQKQASLSANVSAAKAPDKQLAIIDKSPVTATVRSLTPETAATVDKPVKIDCPADLKTFISDQADTNTQKLEDVLETAPDSVKPALERAIDIAEKGYDKALKNIENK